jgi:hypothetical protein
MAAEFEPEPQLQDERPALNLGIIGDPVVRARTDSGGVPFPGATPSVRGGAAPGTRYFAGSYLAAVVLGLVPVFSFGQSAWFVPSIVIIAYTVLGLKKAEETATVFEFADSAYYLGFTLSVGSLLASLDPFNLKGHPDPEVVFHLFGLGLLTTLDGVVIRTALQTYYRVPSETVEAINVRLTSAARTYVDRLEMLTAAIDQVLTASSVSLQAAAPKLERLDKALDRALSHSQQTSTLAEQTTERAQAASAAMDELRGSYSRAAADVSKSTEPLGRALGDLTKSLIAGSSATAESLRALQTESSNASSALVNVATKLQAVDIPTDPFTKPVAEFESALRSAAEATVREAGRLESAAAGVVRVVATVDETNRAISAHPFSESLNRLKEHLDRLSGAIDHQRALTEAELPVLVKHVSATLNTSRELASALDEITNVALSRLATMKP